jgi:hypothetical protein
MKAFRSSWVKPKQGIDWIIGIRSCCRVLEIGISKDTNMKLLRKCTANGRNIIRKVKKVATADEFVTSAGVPCVNPRGLERVCPRVRRVDELLKGPDGMPALRAAVK